MDIGWNLNTVLSIGSLLIAVAGSIWIIRIHPGQYGRLFLLAAAVGVILCYLFIYLGFYSYPFLLIAPALKMPVYLIIPVFPFGVLFSVRYSPRAWGWKIAFYWALMQIGATAEALVEMNTDIIKYGPHWGIWDSYVWWWLFFVTFEWIGGLLVKSENRKPISIEPYRYGRIGWFLLHFVLMVTLFLAGVYAGITLF